MNEKPRLNPKPHKLAEWLLYAISAPSTRYSVLGYSFLDDDLAGLYVQEAQANQIVRISSFFTLLISCLGIFGLTTLAVSRRVKEIGIRKVLRAGSGQVAHMVMRQFVVLVAVANLIAWPLSYLSMAEFLKDFHYRIELGLSAFILAGLLSIAVAAVTTGYLAMMAATANPVSALRYE